MLFVTERITRARKFQADRSSDITGIHFVQFHSLVRMHLQNSGHALFLLFRGVVHVGAGIQRSGINAEISQLSDKRIRHDLERKRRKRFFIG